MRKDKLNYYLDIALAVSERSTCMRRQYGCVIVKDDRIVSTGYNGSPRGYVNCIDVMECKREKLNIPRGERYEMCQAVHAEANAIIHASYQDLIESTVYIAGKIVIRNKYNNDLLFKNTYDTPPCSMCNLLIKNAKVNNVVYRKSQDEIVVFPPSDLPEY
ncbi:MAG: Cytidine and deoxycytidylate deaminase zinc-binding region [Firmicutes bacterium ADurb.Bin419]|nr:MAG: Cytidine and deoxycytidylate deaminase zinc-binding region [Firmicutes bacterium ADurb.Bin419]